MQYGANENCYYLRLHLYSLKSTSIGELVSLLSMASLAPKQACKVIYLAGLSKNPAWFNHHRLSLTLFEQ
jgi:hypothetical protein